MDKTTKFEAEQNRFLEYLKNNSATCGEASIVLGIYRPNACRYKSKLEEKGLLIVIGKKKCSITGFPADVLTCNEFLIHQHKMKLPQLALAI